MRFDHVALRQKEGAREQLVSWRDGFHIRITGDPIAGAVAISGLLAMTRLTCPASIWT